jgi:hypothetical protein
LVFVVVAFPPPPVTFPATRLKSEDLSDCDYFKADHFPEARLRFYPRRSRKPCDSPEAKPFGFQRGRNSCNSRLLPLPNNASPHRFASLLAGHDARKQRDRVSVILSPQKQVKQKIL